VKTISFKQACDFLSQFQWINVNGYPAKVKEQSDTFISFGYDDEDGSHDDIKEEENKEVEVTEDGLVFLRKWWGYPAYVKDPEWFEKIDRIVVCGLVDVKYCVVP